MIDTNDMIRVEPPFPVVEFEVIGYHQRYRQPVIGMSSGVFLLSQVQRAAWDRGEESPLSEQDISEVYEGLTERGVFELIEDTKDFKYHAGQQENQ